jgi:hypothetical protein
MSKQTLFSPGIEMPFTVYKTRLRGFSPLLAKERQERNAP